MKRLFSKTLLMSLTAALALCTGLTAQADDIEIYLGADAEAQAARLRPNILFVVDTSGSMNRDVNGSWVGATNTNSRMAIVKRVTANILGELQNVNVGIMRFDGSSSNGWSGGYVVHPVENIGAATSVTTNSKTARQATIDHLNALPASGNTPLSETLYEAIRYFRGMSPDFGGNSDVTTEPAALTSSGAYDSPVVSQCQENFVVMLTDGLPTADKASSRFSNLPGFDNTTCGDGISSSTGLYDSGDDDGRCLDNLASYASTRDLFGASTPDNILKTIAVGFGIQFQALDDTAAAGGTDATPEAAGGEAYTSTDEAGLTSDLRSIFAGLQELGEGSFSAPSVPVDSFGRTSHLNQVFLTMFSPQSRAHWDGNLKKYTLGSSTTGRNIVGSDGAVAIDPVTGFFAPDAWSYWSDAADGAEVTLGGAANELTATRNVFTNPASGTNVALSGHVVSDTNGTMDSYLNSVMGVSDSAERTKMLKFAAGIDPETGDARKVMGDPLHSKPVSIVYGGTATSPEVVVFVGTNDGYLHAINGTTGAEIFSFLPDVLWKNIPKLYENPFTFAEKVYGVDGPTTAWVDDGGDGSIGGSDHVYLYFGLRRGGSTYYALDVSDITGATPNPKMMWKYTLPDGAQSWSQPTLGKIDTGSGERPVIVVGGGYDTNQDSNDGYEADNKGRRLVMIDALNGSVLWSGGANGTGNTTSFNDMDNAIPSRVTVLDTDRDGLTDRMYVGDTGGQVWRFDVHNGDDGGTFKVSGGVMAELGGAGPASNNAATNRRFYYAPDTALGRDDDEGFFNIAIASGYRARPTKTNNDDFLYVIRDYKPFQPLGSDASVGDGDSNDYSNAYSYEHDDFVTITTSGATVPPGGAGIKQALTSSGEKSLARARVFQDKAFFTSYSPDSSADPAACVPAIGTGRLYELDLKTGLSSETTLQTPGIPPEVTFVFNPPDDDGIDTDECFGRHCINYVSTPPCDPSDPTCTATTPDPDDPGRDVDCLVGVETCTAGGSETAVRTFWIQQGVGE